MMPTVIGEDGTGESVGLTPAKEEFLPKHVQKDLLSGTSALGIGVIAERGCSFLANILAARIGGASNFGVYALAISTANNISAYAAGGIGSTAIRFSGEHPRGSSSYPTLTRVLAIISVCSALLATAVLWLGASPIAALLKKQSLTGPLRWAALSAAGIILLECCRGFLVGQRRIKALLLLSGMVGAGYLIFLPIMAHIGPTQMIASQSGIMLGAVGLCLLGYRSLGLAPPAPVGEPAPVGPLLRQVWSFGLVQLAGLMGMNAAGWWLTTLIARSDSTMAQMGFFAVAHQLRNIVALAPSLLTEGALAVMAGKEGKVEKTPDNVMAICTYASTFMSLLLAGLGMIIVPWGLQLLYGATYSAASLATAIALATAVVHMGSAPMSARLSIVSIRTTGVINTVWAISVAAAATLILFNHGNAAKGAAVYLAGHLFVASLQISTLFRRGCLPKGTLAAFGTGTATALGMILLAVLREVHPEQQLVASGLMILCFVLGLLGLMVVGRRRQWLPSVENLHQLTAKVGSMVNLGRLRRSPR